MEKKKFELLAPAGDMERLEYALRYGADAVYAAYTAYGMRAGSRNFSYEQLSDAVAQCHAAGKRLYLTVNTFPTPQNEAALPDFFRQMAKIRPDAFIIADLGVLQAAKRYAPEVEIHVSTQANITSAGAACAYHALGAKRVVLARELSLADIANIRQNTPDDLELECFVHGSMCMAVSGRCHLSYYLTGREANAGECAQPCRWKYYVSQAENSPPRLSVEEFKEGSYLFNARDLCMLEHIGKLMEIGVDSFKIEGRAKSFYYVASSVYVYRRAMDEILSLGALRPETLSSLQATLSKVSHREYCTGFYFDKDGGGNNLQTGGYFQGGEVVAVVLSQSDGFATLLQKNKFSVGESLEILSPRKDGTPLKVLEMFDETGLSIQSAPHAHQIVKIPCDLPLKKYDILRRTAESV